MRVGLSIYVGSLAKHIEFIQIASLILGIEDGFKAERMRAVARRSRKSLLFHLLHHTPATIARDKSLFNSNDDLSLHLY